MENAQRRVAVRVAMFAALAVDGVGASVPFAPAPGQDATPRPLALRERAELDLGFGASARSLAFSGDGRLLASASDSGEVVVTEVETGVVIARFLAAHRAPSLALSRDGTRLASVAGDLRVFAIPSGELVAAHAVKTAAGAWSPDGTLLAVQTAAAEVGLFAGEDGAEVRRLPLTEVGTIQVVEFASDGQQLTLILGRGKGSLSTLDLRTGTQRVLARGAVVGAVSFTPGHWLVAHSAPMAPELGSVVQSLGWARGLVAAPSAGAFLLEGTEGWRWQTGRGETRCRLPLGDVAALRSAGDLAAVAHAGVIQLVRPDGTLARELRVHRLTPYQVAISGDNRHVVATSPLPAWSGSRLCVFDLTTGERTSVNEWPGPRALRSVPGTPDILLVGMQHQLWNPKARRVTNVVGSGGRPVWSPDARWMWFGAERTAPSSQEGVEVLDVVARTWRFTPMPDGQRPLAWQRGGELLLVGHSERGATDLSVIDGSRVRTRGSLGATVDRAEWSPDGRSIALLTSVGLLVLDAATLAEKAMGPADCAWVRYLDAGHLVCSTDNRIHILSAATGEEILVRALRPESGRAPREQGVGGAPGDASADGRLVAVTDAVGVQVFEVIR